MDEQHSQVKLLLTRAADAAGAFSPPPVEDFTGHQHQHQRFRTRATLAVLVSAAAIVAIAVGLTLSGVPHRAPAAHETSPAPGPTAPAVPASTVAGYQWRPLPPAPIAERTYPASAWTGRLLIIWGGQGAHDALEGDGATYDPATRTWAKLPPSPLGPRVDMVSAWVDGQFIIWGGYDDQRGHRATDGASYDPQTRTWTRLAAAPIASYGLAELVVAGGRAVLLTAPPNGSGPALRADAYDPASNSWQALPDLAASPNHEVDNLTALGVDGSVLVWLAWDHSTVLSSDKTGVTVTISSGVDPYSLDVDARKWSDTKLTPDRGRFSFQAIWTGQQIVWPEEQSYCGSCKGPPQEDVPGDAIDPHTGRRTTIPAGPVNGTGVNYLWTGAALIAVDMGSEDGHSMLMGDAAAWDPNTGNWTRLPRAVNRGKVTYDVSVWTGTRMLLWGSTLPHGNAQSASTGIELAPPNP